MHISAAMNHAVDALEKEAMELSAQLYHADETLEALLGRLKPPADGQANEVGYEKLGR